MPFLMNLELEVKNAFNVGYRRLGVDIAYISVYIEYIQ